MAARAQKPALDERLGGIYSISCVVDDLIYRVMTDARLNANPLVNEAHHKCRRQGLSISLLKWSVGQVAGHSNTADARCVSLINI